MNSTSYGASLRRMIQKYILDPLSLDIPMSKIGNDSDLVGATID